MNVMNFAFVMAANTRRRVRGENSLGNSSKNVYGRTYTKTRIGRYVNIDL